MKQYISKTVLAALLLCGLFAHPANAQEWSGATTTVNVNVNEVAKLSTADVDDSVKAIWRTSLLDSLSDAWRLRLLDSLKDAWRVVLLDSLREAYRLGLIDSVKEEISDSLGANLTIRGNWTFAMDSTVFDSMAVIGSNGLIKFNATLDTNLTHVPPGAMILFNDSLWRRSAADSSLRNIERN